MSQSDCSKDGPPEIPHRPSTETEIGHKCPEEEQMRKLLELCLCVFSRCVWSHGFYFKICDTDRFWYLPFPWLHHYMLIVYIYIPLTELRNKCWCWCCVFIPPLPVWQHLVFPPTHFQNMFCCKTQVNSVFPPTHSSRNTRELWFPTHPF